MILPIYDENDGNTGAALTKPKTTEKKQIRKRNWSRTSNLTASKYGSNTALGVFSINLKPTRPLRPLRSLSVKVTYRCHY